MEPTVRHCQGQVHVQFDAGLVEPGMVEFFFLDVIIASFQFFFFWSSSNWLKYRNLSSRISEVFGPNLNFQLKISPLERKVFFQPKGLALDPYPSLESETLRGWPFFLRILRGSRVRLLLSENRTIPQPGRYKKDTRSFPKGRNGLPSLPGGRRHKRVSFPRPSSSVQTKSSILDTPPS